jgi:hypothetical protein
MMNGGDQNMGPSQDMPFEGNRSLKGGFNIPDYRTND